MIRDCVNLRSSPRVALYHYQIIIIPLPDVYTRRLARALREGAHQIVSLDMPIIVTMKGFRMLSWAIRTCEKLREISLPSFRCNNPSQYMQRSRLMAGLVRGLPSTLTSIITPRMHLQDDERLMYRSLNKVIRDSRSLRTLKLSRTITTPLGAASIVRALTIFPRHRSNQGVIMSLAYIEEPGDGSEHVADAVAFASQHSSSILDLELYTNKLSKASEYILYDAYVRSVLLRFYNVERLIRVTDQGPLSPAWDRLWDTRYAYASVMTMYGANIEQSSRSDARETRASKKRKREFASPAAKFVKKDGDHACMVRVLKFLV